MAIANGEARVGSAGVGQCGCNGKSAAEMLTASVERPVAITWPEAEQGSAARVEQLGVALLESCGEDPLREGLVRTPHRFAKAMREMTVGYSQSLPEIVNGAVFTEAFSDMVLVKGVEFYSLCEHHLLPFFGKAHIAYIPNGRIIGLSKLPRIVNMFARRLQVQERLTQQIVEAVTEVIDPLGVACVIEGNHMCMMMRGVESQGASMRTSALRGIFAEDRSLRDEFLRAVG